MGNLDFLNLLSKEELRTELEKQFIKKEIPRSPEMNERINNDSMDGFIYSKQNEIRTALQTLDKKVDSLISKMEMLTENINILTEKKRG